MTRTPRMGAAERMRHLLHDLSQPLTAAALSVDTAAIVLHRGEAAAAQVRIDAAARALARALMMLRILKISGGRGPSVRHSRFDPARILQGLVDGLELPSVGDSMGDPDYFAAALAGLVMTLAPSPEFCRAAPLGQDGGVRLTLRGTDTRSPLLPFWLAALRRDGVITRARRLEGDIAITLSLTAPRR